MAPHTGLRVSLFRISRRHQRLEGGRDESGALKDSGQGGFGPKGHSEASQLEGGMSRPQQIPTAVETSGGNSGLNDLAIPQPGSSQGPVLLRELP